MSSIAIIGAGSSGLAAAHTLQDADHSVTLFEKSRGVGGRAATRRRAGFVYDHGAQYIKGEGRLSAYFITERFYVPDLIDITKPVWIFDSAGRIQEGDPQQNATPRWTYRHGLTTLAERMAAGLSIHFNVCIGHVEQMSTGWALFDIAGQHAGNFEQLLITIPAPQALELLQMSQLERSLRDNIVTALAVARYNPLISVMLGYQPTPMQRPYYALVNTDKAHPISWLAWEHEKAPERVPPGSGLLIAQMAPQYSREHWKQPDEQALIRDVTQLVAGLIDEPLPTPIFTDIQYWLHALPSTKADAQTLNAQTLPYGLAFCGDAFVGGRVHLALEHGVTVAQQMIHGI
jgi:renalase